MEPGKTIYIGKFHQITGHTGEHLLKPTATYMKLKLIGRLPPCEVCAQAKIRQRNIPTKKMKKLPTRPGYRVFMDICSFKQVSRGGNRHWLIVVDEFSDCTHSFFLNKKSDQIKIMPMWIKGIAKKYKFDIKRIRLDNSGENRSLQKECDKQNLGIIFEFTAPGTPQQNSIAERRIPTLMGRARAMLIQAGLESKYKGEFWCEVISTATKLDNIMVRPERTKPPHTLFYGKDAKYMRCLRTFGEKAVVAIQEDERSFGETSIEEIEEDTESDGNNTKTQKKLGIDINMVGAREETLGRTRSETKELSSPTNKSMERADLTMEDWIQETCVISAVTSGPTEPKTLPEAWHHQVENERNSWRTAIRKEIRSMIERGIWTQQQKTYWKQVGIQDTKRWHLQGKISGIGIQSNSRSGLYR